MTESYPVWVYKYEDGEEKGIVIDSFELNDRLKNGWFESPQEAKAGKTDKAKAGKAAKPKGGVTFKKMVI